MSKNYSKSQQQAKDSILMNRIAMRVQSFDNEEEKKSPKKADKRVNRRKE